MPSGGARSRSCRRARRSRPRSTSQSGHVIATTGGYIGDAPPYQGHVVVIAARNGRLLHVWNSLCSNWHVLIYPSRCPASDSAIWGRAGAVVVPGSGKLLVATGNAPWNGHTNWGDAVLVLSAKAKLVGNYTPTNTAKLNSDDLDLGSTSPVYLTSKLIAQGGKDGKIRLLSLSRMRGTKPHKGHELQIVSTPSGSDLFTAPAVWRSGKRIWLIAADNGATQAWSLRGGRLHSVWRNGNPGTSPLISGGYVYRGTAVRAARGRYFYGDFCEGTIWSFRVGKHGRASAAAVSGNVPSLSSFGVDGHGELYAVSLGGTLYRLR